MSTLVQNSPKRKARRIANFFAPVETPQVVAEPTLALAELPITTAPVPRQMLWPSYGLPRTGQHPHRATPTPITSTWSLS